MVVCYAAIFCDSSNYGFANNGNASSYASVLPVSVFLTFMAVSMVIMPLLVVVYTAFFCTTHAYGNAISLNASSGSV